jgi:hypothetical protein
MTSTVAVTAVQHVHVVGAGGTARPAADVVVSSAAVDGVVSDAAEERVVAAAAP